MIIRGTPKDIENYIRVDNDYSQKLQKQGFMPLFMDSDYFYFKKSADLFDLLEEEKMKWTE